jgi:pyridoxine 5-phosphate synthase
LVPEKREEVTTEGGLDVVGNQESLRQTVGKLQSLGIRVSLFIDSERAQIKAAADVGAEMIELHTGTFALTTGNEHESEIKRLQSGAELGNSLGLQINVGHGIHLENVKDLFSVKNLKEFNVGHTLISRGLFVGIRSAVIEMKAAMQGYPTA